MLRVASIPGFSIALAILPLLAAPETARAQHDVHRQRFTFPGGHLTIDVQATTPGTLRIARGGLGTVEVAGRAPGGFVAAGLEGRSGDRLVLTALGGERADYLVLVPRDVMVRVILPDRPVAESFGALARDGSYSWGQGPAPEPVEVHAAAPPNLPADPAPLPFQYRADETPARVVIRGGHEIALLSVRREGGEFQVAADDAATILERDGTLELLPDPGVDRMVITIPWVTGDFELVSGRGVLLRIQDGSTASICPPATEQTMEGRIWYTFSPPPTPGAPCVATGPAGDGSGPAGAGASGQLD